MTLDEAKSKSIFMILHYLADYIHPNATIDSRSIHFRSGTHDEKLLQVPIAAAGELDAHASVRVTVGLTPVNGESDPIIGISDGINQNSFFIIRPVHC